MKKIYTHSKNSLFLMEMILVLLFLALSSVACIRIFAAAGQNRAKAAEWRHIQALTTSVGEILEGTDGSADSISEFLPDSTKESDSLSWYYDTNWENCSSEKAAYKMELTLSANTMTKNGILTFCSVQGETADEIYHIDLAFPQVSSYEKEETS